MWILAKIAKRISIQSHEHTNNITMYYKIMADAAAAQFTEDNKETLDSFLVECHRKSLNV